MNESRVFPSSFADSLMRERFLEGMLTAYHAHSVDYIDNLVLQYFPLFLARELNAIVFYFIRNRILT